MSDPEITLHAREWKITATEKVSIDQYEPFTVHTAIEGEIPPIEGELTPERRTELKARLLNLHKDAQETVERAAENRIALPESEDWGVRNGDE